LQPPASEHVGAVYRLLAPSYRLPLLWLDWSGTRVARWRRCSSVTTTSRGVECVCVRRRRRRELHSGSSCPTCSRMRSRRHCPHARIGTWRLRSSPMWEPIACDCDRASLQGGRRPGLLASRPASPPNLAPSPTGALVGGHRRIRRPAVAEGDRRHVHAWPSRRSRCRLRRSAQLTDVLGWSCDRS